MKRITRLVGAGLLSSSIIAHAGFYANTSHSRANCTGFNESITWNWSEYHWWEVESMHYRQKGSGPDTHRIISRMAYTWRAAAYDFWKDPSGPMADQYWVQGYHFYMARDGSRVYDSYTQAGNCNIYDGWWDHNKARGE